MRILLDTNIIVSSLLSHAGPSGQLMAMWGDDEFTLVTSTYQLNELRRVIEYSHLRPKVADAKAAAFLANADKKAIVLDELPHVDHSEDPQDNPILATAIAGEADLVVSGDKGHMQILGIDMGEGTLITVNFEESEGKTTLITLMEYKSKKDRDAALATGMTAHSPTQFPHLIYPVAPV